MKTVKELKEFLKDLPDDTPIVQFTSNMERDGYLLGASARVATMTKTKKSTWDRFDGTPYSYEIFVPSDKGIQTLVLG